MQIQSIMRGGVCEKWIDCPYGKPKHIISSANNLPKNLKKKKGNNFYVSRPEWCISCIDLEIRVPIILNRTSQHPSLKSCFNCSKVMQFSQDMIHKWIWWRDILALLPRTCTPNCNRATSIQDFLFNYWHRQIN